MIALFPAERIGVGASEENRFWASDQDALNAVLMSEVPPESLHYLHPAEMMHARMLPRMSVRDPRTLEATFLGRPTRLLHSSWAPKPWIPGAWVRGGPNAYARLLPCLLFEQDLPLRLGRSDVPPWLGPGASGAVLRGALAVLHGARRTVGAIVRKLPTGALARVLAARDRLDRWLGFR